MNGGLTFEVEHGHPVVLRADRGMLDAVTAADLRAGPARTAWPTSRPRS